jgi:hypothetical protein
VLEQIFAVLVASMEALRGDGGAGGDGLDRGSTCPDAAVTVTDIVEWIELLVNLKGFGFNARFFSSELKESVCMALENSGAGSAVELCSNFRTA